MPQEMRESCIKFRGGYECPVPGEIYEVMALLENKKIEKYSSDELSAKEQISMIDRETAVFWSNKATEYKTGKTVYTFGFSGESKVEENGKRQQIARKIICKSDKHVKRIYKTLQKFHKLNSEKYCFPFPAAKICSRERAEDIYESIGTVAVIDVEMSWQFPIQFAGILVKFENGGLNVISEQTFYLRSKASKRISKKVTEITGLTAEFIEENGISINDAEHRLRLFFYNADTICGQGVINDIKALQKIFEYAHRSKPTSLKYPKIIDTLILYRYLSDGAKRVDLETMAQKFGIETESEKMHDALGDTRLTLEILKRAEPLFISKFAESPVRSLEYFYAPKGRGLINEIFPVNYKKNKNRKGVNIESGVIKNSLYKEI